MTKKLDNTQFQNATASTLKAVSGNLENEREIKFSGNTSYLSTKEIRLPQILKDLDNKQLTKLRGEADKIALKLKYHDPALFSKLLPSSDLSSQIFKLAEDARIEAVGSKHFSGIKNNLQSLIVEQYKETILPIPGGDDKEALVKALHLVIREKITKSDAPSNTSISLEKWRPWINSKIGNLLNQLQENIANQEKFAAKTKELLTALKAEIGETDSNNNGDNEENSEDTNSEESDDNDNSSQNEGDDDQEAGLDGGSDSQEDEGQIEGDVQDDTVRTIDISSKVSVEMRHLPYSALGVSDQLTNPESYADLIFHTVVSCITAVLTEDERLLAEDETRADLEEFVGSLTTQQFTKLREFVENAPSVSKLVEFDCEKCQHSNKYILNGLQDFFG